MLRVGHRKSGLGNGALRSDGSPRAMAGQSKGIRMRAHALYIARLQGSHLRSEFHSRIVSRLLPRIGDGWVVDIGCGPGLLGARIAAARPQARTVGIDIDAEMLRAAREMAGFRVVRA